MYVCVSARKARFPRQRCKRRTLAPCVNIEPAMRGGGGSTAGDGGGVSKRSSIVTALTDCSLDDYMFNPKLSAAHHLLSYFDWWTLVNRHDILNINSCHMPLIVLNNRGRE